MKKLCERHPSIHRHVTIPKRGKSKTAHPWKWIRLQLAVHNDPEAFPHERTTGNVALEMWNGFIRQGWWRGGRRFRGSSRSVIGSIQRMSRPLTRDSSPSPSPGLPSPAIVDAQCPTLYSSSTPLLGYNTLLLELGLFLPPRCVTQSREGRFFGSFKCLSSGVVAIQFVECELFFGFWCVILDLECLRAGGFLGVVMIFGRSDVGGCRWRSLSILVVCILYVVRCPCFATQSLAALEVSVGDVAFCSLIEGYSKLAVVSTLVSQCVVTLGSKLDVRVRCLEQWSMI